MAVARRLRGKLAEAEISGSELARRLGETQSTISRRMKGKVDFSVTFIEHVEEVTGISAKYLLTGEGDHPVTYRRSHVEPRRRRAPKGPADEEAARVDLGSVWRAWAEAAAA